MQPASTNTSELDFFSLAVILFNAKYKIIMFTIVAGLIGQFFLANAEERYESYIDLRLDPSLAVGDFGEVFFKFENIFFDGENFRNWATQSPNSVIDFDEIDRSELRNGILFAKTEKSVLEIKSLATGGNVIRIEIHDDNLNRLEGFHSYAQFVNNIFSKAHRVQIKQSLDTMNRLIYEEVLYSAEFWGNYLSTNAVLTRLNDGATIFHMSDPTFPKKISPRPVFVTVISVGAGLLLGIIFVLLQAGFSSWKSRVI